MKEPKHISEFMDTFIESVDKKSNKNSLLNKINWQEIVGESLAKHSKVEYINSNNLLIISTDSSAYIFKLTMIQNTILNKLKKLYPEINIFDIKFRLKSGG